jgi:hypothetical protein
MMPSINEIYGHRIDTLGTSSDFIAGLECEIESVRSRTNIGCFRITETGVFAMTVQSLSLSH